MDASANEQNKSLHKCIATWLHRVDHTAIVRRLSISSFTFIRPLSRWYLDSATDVVQAAYELMKQARRICLSCSWVPGRSKILVNKIRAVLSQGKPRDAAVNFDRYWILQLRRAVSLPLHVSQGSTVHPKFWLDENFLLVGNFLRKSIEQRRKCSPSNSENLSGLSRATSYLNAF